MYKTNTLSKAEFATLRKVCAKTLATLLNVKDYKKLQKLGYEKNMRILPEQVIKFYYPDFSFETSPSYLSVIYPNLK